MKVSRSGLLALLIVYLVWGSSFLAIRLAVSGSGAFGPYSLAAIRTLSAGALLLGCALFQGHSLSIGWRRLRWLALTGILLWIGGHALVIWSERRMSSGLAALIFASTPLWAALLVAARTREWSAASLLPVLVGFLGVGIVLPLGGTPPGGGLWIDGVAGKGEGARLRCGGKPPDFRGADFDLRQGFFLTPAVFADCGDHMKVVREEIFGPVMTVLPFRNEEEVIVRANSTDFGLAAGVFTRDLARAHRVVARLDAGTCWINTYNVKPVEIPFGGVKHSGLGRENGLESLEHYTRVKSVYVEMGELAPPF